MRGDPLAHPALYDAAKKPFVYGGHSGKKVGCPDRHEEGFGHGRTAAGYQSQVHGVEKTIAGYLMQADPTVQAGSEPSQQESSHRKWKPDREIKGHTGRFLLASSTSTWELRPRNRSTNNPRQRLPRPGTDQQTLLPLLWAFDEMPSLTRAVFANCALESLTIALRFAIDRA